MGTFFIISSLENSGPGLKEGRKRPNIFGSKLDKCRTSN